MVNISASTEVKINKEKPKERLAQATESTVRSGATVASSKIPVDSGRAKNELKVSKINRFTWALISGVKYSSAIEFGTEAHTITPTDAEALYWEGADHPVKKVEHPGTPAQPYMRPALSHMIDVAPRKFEIYMKD